MVNIDKLIRTKRKSLKIEINELGNVIVYAPVSYSIDKIMKFIESKEKWIMKHQSTIRNNLAFNKSIIDYEKILILGEIVPIIEGNERKTQFLNDALFIKKNLDEIKRLRVLEKFLKSYCSEIIQNRLNYFSNLMQLAPNSVKFANAKKRWGSCDSLGNISFNWRIIMLPPVLIDYIIIHEFAHLIEMNHSSSFWEIVASIMPNWKENRELLKKSNFILTLFR